MIKMLLVLLFVVFYVYVFNNGVLVTFMKIMKKASGNVITYTFVYPNAYQNYCSVNFSPVTSSGQTDYTSAIVSCSNTQAVIICNYKQCTGCHLVAVGF